jgi:2-polyprenyl-6-methoxyphenol hydroxylase-like FAD-dependent oxidoreductase
MNFNISSTSLLSYIMALSLNEYGIDKISLRKQKLKTYGRYYSINYFSKKFLEHIKIWDHMESKSIVPYNTIEIYKKDIKTLSFYAKDINIDCLGYIVNEDNLVNSVTKIIMANNSFNFTPKKNYSDNLSTCANIISDYKDVSPEIQSRNYTSKTYNQTAININITHSKSNNNIPRQIFFDNEILGFLPINEYCYNLIWSMPNNLYEKISIEDMREYKTFIEERANFILGEIQEMTIGESFPLSARHADVYFYQNNFLIGESAHKFHPLAGLGLNMGIEDISSLTQLILKHDDLKVTFREYAIKRIAKNNSLQNILDLIIQFHSSKLMPDDLKKYLLYYFDKTLLMKPIIIKKATGCDNTI